MMTYQPNSRQSRLGLSLQKNFGVYYPSFFFLKVESDFSPEKSPDEIASRTLFHEYVHFFQDTATTYGLSNIARTIDLLKQFSKAIRESPTNEVSIPFGTEMQGKAGGVNVNLLSCYAGDGAEKFTQVPKVGISVSVEESSFPIDVMGQMQDVAVYELVVTGASHQTKFHFGAMAILESMAHLLEKQNFGDNNTCLCFPYDAARLVADSITRVPLSERALCEFCEAALMYDNPAEVFVQSLRTFRQDQADQIQDDQIYQRVISLYKLTDETGHEKSANQLYRDRIELAQMHLGSIFTVPPYSEETWASDLVGGMVKKKDECVSLTSALWENGMSTINDLTVEVGCPVIFNNKEEALVSNAHTQLKTPTMFPAVFTAFSIFTRSQCNCKLYGYCTLRGDVSMDDRCQARPWDRASTGETCNFSNLWKMWSFKDVKITPSA